MYSTYIDVNRHDFTMLSEMLVSFSTYNHGAKSWDKFALLAPEMNTASHT